jgi:small subunit ribosomal protein S20
MANLKASKKDIVRNKRNHDRNKHLKTMLKTALKSGYSAISSLNDDTKSLVATVCRTVDKMTSKGIIKKKTGARKKSRLMTAFNTAVSQSSK